MKNITFPSLNLSFKIDSIAVSFGNTSIYWYAICIVIAFVISIILCKKDDGKYNIKFVNILEVLIILIPVSIFCVRLYYVLFKLDYYFDYPKEILDFRNGGLAIYGGIIGAIIVITIYCKKNKINIFDMLDYIAPYLSLRPSDWKMGKFF